MTKLAGDPTSRRRFLRTSGTLVALIPVVNLVGCAEESAQAPAEESMAEPSARPDQAAESAREATETAAESAAETASQAAPEEPAEATGAAQQMVQLEESDPQAQALGYRHSASDVDAASYPRFQQGQACSNCSLFNADQGAEGWGGCSIFPGKLVAADGWCNAYVPAA